MPDEGGRRDQGKVVQHVLHMGTLLAFIFQPTNNQPRPFSGQGSAWKNSKTNIFFNK